VSTIFIKQLSIVQFPCKTEKVVGIRWSESVISTDMWFVLANLLRLISNINYSIIIYS